jgi:hypothetical protein
MADTWVTVGVSDVVPGDRVRLRSGQELDVARIDSPFLGVVEMVCFVEDTPSRWHAYPARRDDSVEVLRAT